MNGLQSDNAQIPRLHLDGHRRAGRETLPSTPDTLTSHDISGRRSLRWPLHLTSSCERSPGTSRSTSSPAPSVAVQVTVVRPVGIKDIDAGLQVAGSRTIDGVHRLRRREEPMRDARPAVPRRCCDAGRRRHLIRRGCAVVVEHRHEVATVHEPVRDASGASTKTLKYSVGSSTVVVDGDVDVDRGVAVCRHRSRRRRGDLHRRPCRLQPHTCPGMISDP